MHAHLIGAQRRSVCGLERRDHGGAEETAVGEANASDGDDFARSTVG
jgi:hypothetical protein